MGWINFYIGREFEPTMQSNNASNFNDTVTFDMWSLPWYIHGMDHFEVAVTGNAFMFLINKIKLIKQNNPDSPKEVENWLENKILQKIIKKAKVFVRMVS